MATTTKEKLRYLATTIFPHGVFWSWNAIFLCTVYLGLLPEILWSLMRATIAGPVPWDFTLFSLLLLFVPLFCTIFGAVLFRREPLKLLGLFYGIEAPLLLLGSIRLFLIREMTPGVAMLLGSFYVAAFFYLYELVKGYRDSSFIAAVQLIGHTTLLLTGLYIGAIVAFYVPPAVVAFLEAFFTFHWLRDFFDAMRQSHGTALFFLPLGFLLFSFSALLFFGTPIAWMVLAVRSFRRVYAAFARQFGRARATGIAATTMFLLLALFFTTNHQPQSAAFALLKDLPRSDAERQARLHKESLIRAGLLNAYLSPFRYFSAVDENDHVESMYRKVFGSTGNAPLWIQKAYNGLARPVLFRGHSMLDDQRKAEELYEQFFDTPLQKGDQEAVVRALESTWSLDQREAGLINQGQRKVWLLRQEIRTQPHGDWAEIELHEVYENQTYEQQEIFYYFSLPASAAVTGLWLGDSEDRAKRFPFVVAPRGAAQKVYKQEVQRRSDPALLEQIGPRQYRLRAFPIPQKQGTKLEPAPAFHLWLTYKTFAENGNYPLPVLGERRNVYWSWQSKRTVDGKTERFGRDWLPKNAGAAAPLTVHEAVLPDGILVRARPMVQAQVPQLQNRALAVIIDRSKSMSRVDAELQKALSYLNEVAQRQHDDLDYYLSASPFRGEEPLRIDEPSALPTATTLYYGAQKSRDMLVQFCALKKDKHYDAVLVLTDDGSLDLASDKGPTVISLAPVFMVHLGGRLSPGYDDTTLAAIQKSGGGAARSVPEALQTLALLLQPTEPNSAAEIASYEDGLLWTVEPAQPGTAATVDDGFLALAARQAILHRTRKAQLGNLEVLDSLHAIAKRHGVVSPYSSMLVLVNDAQRELLKKAEAEKDRFNREVESGKESLSPLMNPLHVSGAPEPHEWLLLAIAAALLIYTHKKHRLQPA